MQSLADASKWCTWSRLKAYVDWQFWKLGRTSNRLLIYWQSSLEPSASVFGSQTSLTFEGSTSTLCARLINRRLSEPLMRARSAWTQAKGVQYRQRIAYASIPSASQGRIWIFRHTEQSLPLILHSRLLLLVMCYTGASPLSPCNPLSLYVTVVTDYASFTAIFHERAHYHRFSGKTLNSKQRVATCPVMLANSNGTRQTKTKAATFMRFDTMVPTTEHHFIAWLILFFLVSFLSGNVPRAPINTANSGATKIMPRDLWCGHLMDDRMPTHLFPSHLQTKKAASLNCH